MVHHHEHGVRHDGGSVSGDTRRASRAARDIIIFAVTCLACSVGACVGIVAVNLTGANDAPRTRPAATVDAAQVEAWMRQLDEVRPVDLPEPEREAVADMRDVLESIEAGDTILITPPASSTTTTPTTAAPAPPSTVAPEAHDDHRTGPLVTLYPPATLPEVP